jgi:hypothetical protein
MVDSEDRRKINSKVFHLPENWQFAVIDERWPPVVINADILELKVIGWRGSDETAGLLEDFLRLARDSENQHTLDDKTTEAVQTFAKTWGPLWRRTNDGHWDCHWTSYSAVVQKHSHADGRPQASRRLPCPGGCRDAR